MNMKKRYFFVIVMMFLLTALLSGCIPGDGASNAENTAGFFSGIWHGWIAPISLIIGVFNHDIRVYEIYNSGWWYDFGFYIAVISGFGGLSLFRRKKVERN